jgi:hypothetical protein
MRNYSFLIWGEMGKDEGGRMKKDGRLEMREAAKCEEGFVLQLG